VFVYGRLWVLVRDSTMQLQSAGAAAGVAAGAAPHQLLGGVASPWVEGLSCQCTATSEWLLSGEQQK
jgi:hypothetical protein